MSETPGFVFLVDRPIKGKTALYAPWPPNSLPSVATRDLKRAIGKKAQITRQDWAADPLGSPTHVKYTFARQYTQSVVTWLRMLPECEVVRLRVEYVLRDDGNPHCTPQCEGAWASNENAGIMHEDVCQCQCGGLKHNSGNPWWRRWNEESVVYGATVHEIRMMPGLTRADASE